MPASAPTDWSPADHPYAIALSEANWWLQDVVLTIGRLHDSDDRRIPFSSRQLDARHLVFALRQLLAGELLEQTALRALGIDPSVGDALRQARERFEDALPGIKHMRDGLMHFDEWSRGEGRGPQKEGRDAGHLPRDVARTFWRFAYDPNANTVSLGPYTIHVEAAGQAALELFRAIDMASHEVDKRNTADLRSKTIRALDIAGVSCELEGGAVKVSPGADQRIWLSLDTAGESDEGAHQHLAAQVVAALDTAGLHLASPACPEGQDTTERLVRGEPLRVERATVT
jgi:hypothetical protein